MQVATISWAKKIFVQTRLVFAWTVTNHDIIVSCSLTDKDLLEVGGKWEVIALGYSCQSI